ncbi:MAG: DUF4097 family beta strand repeat-containing protein [Treponemataceae bacterium]
MKKYRMFILSFVVFLSSCFVSKDGPFLVDEKIENEKWLDYVISGESKVFASLDNFEIEGVYANLDINSSSESDCIKYEITGLTEDFIEIEEMEKSFSIREIDFLENRPSGRGSKVIVKIKITLPESKNLQNVNLKIRRDLNFKGAISENLNLSTGCGQVRMDLKDSSLKDVVLRTGTGSTCISNFSAEQFDCTGRTGKIELTNCKVNNPEFDLQGALEFQGSASENLNLNAGCGQVRMDLKDSSLKDVVLRTGTGSTCISNFSAEQFDCTGRTGKIQLTNCKVNNPEFKLESCLDFQGNVIGNLKLNAGYGNVYMDLCNSVVENLDVKTGTGTCRIGNFKYKK